MRQRRPKTPICLKLKKSIVIFFCCVLFTEVSQSKGPFVAQTGHLRFANFISKQAINQEDFSTLKIWDQSYNWLRSYGQKVNFLLTES